MSSLSASSVEFNHREQVNSPPDEVGEEDGGGGGVIKEKLSEETVKSTGVTSFIVPPPQTSSFITADMSADSSLSSQARVGGTKIDFAETSGSLGSSLLSLPKAAVPQFEDEYVAAAGFNQKDLLDYMRLMSSRHEGWNEFPLPLHQDNDSKGGKSNDWFEVKVISVAGGFALMLRIPGHGTTTIVLYNQLGVFVISDGRASRSFISDPVLAHDEERDVDRGLVISKNNQKTFILGGGRLIVLGAGCSLWINSIVNHLAIEANLGMWTARRCAYFTRYLMRLDFLDELASLTKDQFKERTATLTFVTFENNTPSVFYANRNVVQEVFSSAGYEGEEQWDLKQGFGNVGYKACGAGSDAANALYELIMKGDHNTSLQKSFVAVLNLMGIAVRESRTTGGTLRMHYMDTEGVVKAVPHFDESEIRDYVTELGGHYIVDDVKVGFK